MIFCCLDNDRLSFLRVGFEAVFLFLAMNGAVHFSAKVQISVGKISNFKKTKYKWVAKANILAIANNGGQLKNITPACQTGRFQTPILISNV